jgi:hypothetical protein
LAIIGRRKRVKTECDNAHFTNKPQADETGGHAEYFFETVNLTCRLEGFIFHSFDYPIRAKACMIAHIHAET